jgi:hypothetical protein
MAEPQTEARTVDGEPPPLLLDNVSDALATFRVLRKSDEAAADELLTQIGGKGNVERDIVFQLGLPKPVYLPERFDQAHRLAMRAIEVLDRNGARRAPLRKLGPAEPVVHYFVQLATRWIVRNHEESLISAMKNLYGRREASCVWGSPEMHMLRRARTQAERLEPGYKGRALGVPTFLLGGAVISTIVGYFEGVTDIVRRDRWFFLSASGVIFLIFLFASWVVLRGAGVARHRIRLTTDRPMKALYETIGGCGNPPTDDAQMFAVIAIALTFLAWIVVPLGVLGAVLL